MIKKTPLQEAVDLAGGQSQLAKKIKNLTGKNIGQGHVWAWINKSNKAPAELCQVIEEITGVEKERLRPDVFLSFSASAPLNNDCQQQSIEAGA